MSSGLEDFSLFDLFRLEAEEQVRVLQTELLQIESGTATVASLEALMRASHSLKGAARIIGLDVIVHLTHAMEDRFVAAQAGHALTSGDVDRMLTATDWLTRLQSVPEAETPAWLEANTAAIEAFAAGLAATASNPPMPVEPPQAQPILKPAPPPAAGQLASTHAEQDDEDIFGQASSRHSVQDSAASERSVRIAAGRFDQILSLASETLVASRKLAAQSDVFERYQRAISRALRQLENPAATPATRAAAEREIDRQTSSLAAHIAELDSIFRANERTSERLHRTVLAGRLRPFSEGITGVARLVRDTARDLGKSVRLVVLGERTRVDRDILERLEAPISHLITNAIDHGIETPADRIAVNKPPEANLRLHVRHENGRLVITVRDDGRGIHREELRERILYRNLVTPETAAGLSDNELLEFLFLPGFSTREAVSTVSGRGVGLNVVQSMVQEAGGSVTVTSEPGAGTVFRLTLPVTRSVIKVIRLQVEGEFYAVPLVRIDRVAHMEPAITIPVIEAPASTVPAANEQLADAGTPTLTIDFNGQALPVVALGALLGLTTKPLHSGSIPMLISGGIAFAVDRLVDEIELPVRRLDRRLGKIPGVSAASLDQNGLPLLILDMEDLIQTVLGRSKTTAVAHSASLAPHILIVDDSHTVREMERRLLVRDGYTVTTAQNGQEAWNLLRLNDYDLLVSDVDMPQMNGIELVVKVRKSPHVARMPIIILSYKDREEDRRRGLDAGADRYLTKADFENDAFRQAVVDLIGAAEPLAETVKSEAAGSTAANQSSADAGGAT
ncbi:MAG: response regulator [Terracidiphilus sp.]|jgi:two-component system sensor histidine kinase and response regulator WspE